MKRVNKLLIGVVGVAAMAVSAVSFAADGGGIKNTRHNLGTSGGTSVGGGATDNHLQSGTAEICVFCHTPHASDSSAPAPLWNRALGANADGVKTGTYTTYDMLGTATLDGRIAMGSNAVGSVSLACLSCHDGATAMDSVINAPGSGKVNDAGAPMANSVWTGDRQTAGKMTNTNGFASMLGVDLRNDHPVGIQYAGGCADANPYVNTTTCTTYKDRDFKVAQSATSLDGRKTWWVDTSGTGIPNARAGVRDVTDMVLYTRSLTSGGTQEPFVECASCHDPHVVAKNANEVQFLRVSQAGSGVCLACHDK